MNCKLISHDKTVIAELTVKDYHAVHNYAVPCCFSLIFGSIVGKSTETCMLVFHSAWPCSQDTLAEDFTGIIQPPRQSAEDRCSYCFRGRGLHFTKMYISVNISCKQTSTQTVQAY